MKKSIDTFDEFIKKKNKQNGKKIDWEDRKKFWLESIELIFNDIDKWLEPHQKKGEITITNVPIEITEVNIGNYKTSKKQIEIGNGFLFIEPIGTIILGAFGRINIYGNKGNRILILENWKKWMFAKRTPMLETWEWNKENFFVEIQELM